MFTNYIKTLFRQLWRSRLFTILNVIGLGVSICVAWIIFRMVSYEYSFDKRIPDAKEIYQVVSKSKFPERKEEVGGFAGTSIPVYNTLKNDISGVKMVVPLFYKYPMSVSIPISGNGQPHQLDIPDDGHQIVSTTSEYFKMFGYKWLVGNEATALDAPDKVVLTDERAKEFFPLLKPNEVLGKRIVYDDTVTRQVSGIVAQLNYPNSFSADNNEFVALDKDDLTDNDWSSMSSADLVFIKPDNGVNPEQVMQQLNVFNTKFNQSDFDKYNFKTWYDVLPLLKKHLEPQFTAQTRTADSKVLKGLMLVGVFLLLLACINYMNLSSALIPSRAREIGIRKTLGSSARGLVFRFMGETLAVASVAAIVSFILTAFAVNIFSDFLPSGMLNYVNYGSMTLFLLGLILLVTLFSGWYPSWLSTKVNTVNVLKGATGNVAGNSGFTLRKGLIVFQFLIAQVFIIGSIVIHQQIKFALTKDLGFNKNGIVTISIPYKAMNEPQYKNKQFVLKNELEREANIQGVSLGNRPLSNNMTGNVLTYYNGSEEIQKQINMKFGDTDYLRVYGFKLLAGRNFVASDTMNEIVINEKAVNAFGFSSPQAAIGKMLVAPYNNKSFPVVGVVADFNQFSVRSKIDPALITTNKRSGSSTLNIKLSNDVSKWKSTLGAIEKDWKKLYVDIPFKYSFYDETVRKLYEGEEKTQTLVSTATAIAILISCLGLFGLATLTAYQRTKEIGVRKVLGASVLGIVRLLSKEFLSLVLISVVIASPIAWWLMNKWLQDYAYKIDIRWWIFLLAAMMACVIALVTVSYQAIKAARANPVDSLRTE